MICSARVCRRIAGHKALSIVLVGLLAITALPATSEAAGKDSIIPPEPGGPQYNRWYTDDFLGPEDGQLWHSAFYLLGVRQEQLLKRHWGLLIRCTKAPHPTPLVVTFAFGSVLRTRERGDISVTLKFDQRPAQRLPLISRNHANAEMTGTEAIDFVQRSLSANQFRVNARLSPKGRGDIRIPLHEGRQVIAGLVKQCNIELSEPTRSLQAATDTPAPATPKTDPLSTALALYWQADSLAARRRAATEILVTQPSFEDLLSALQSTRFYIDPAAAADAPQQGHSFQGQRAQDGVRYPYHLEVPRTYHPDFSSPLYVYLHGGVNRPAWRDNQQWWQHYLFPRDAFVVSPASWRNAFWWHPNQLENLLELVIRLKQRYNIDDRRIHIAGVSDGGAGAFFVGASAPSTFASIASLIGHPGVLESERANSAPPPPLTNLVNRPLFLLNGDSDPLYPVKSLVPYTDRFTDYGVEFETHIQNNSGHTISQPDQVRTQLTEFFTSHQRAKHTTELYWETKPESTNNRIEWLSIDATSRGRTRGCVTARYTTELFEVQAQNVDHLTLLVPLEHPPQVPIRVRLNGRLTEFPAAPAQAATLLKWHARDFDRTRLYQRELHLKASDFPASTQPVCL